MILDKDSITVNGRRVKSAPGNCKTYNKVKIVNVSNNEYIMFQRRDLHDLYASSVRLTDYYNTNEVKTYPKIIVDC